MTDLLPETPFRLLPRDAGRLSPKGIAAAAAERLLAFPDMTRVYHAACATPGESAFNEKVLDVMHVQWDLSPGDLHRIPTTGPLIVVANHPFGGLEGMILAAVLRSVRPDVKLLANYMLGMIPEMRDQFIFVDPFGGADAARKNVGGMKSALRWLRDGGVLGVFPAGEVAHMTWKNRCVTDPHWSDTIGRLAQQTKVPVLPVYFSGRNSSFFQMAGLIHPRLRTVLLPREMMSRRDQTIGIRIGSLIPPDRLARFKTAEEVVAYLRLRTYILKGHAPATRKTASTAPQIVRKISLAKDVVAPKPADLLAEEIAQLPAELRTFATGDFEVFVTPADRIPHTLQEIGRLREITFREVGEGTGREIDLDRFDPHYVHLFVWNKVKQHIVGAYRLGLSDEILATRGVDGFYTRTLFKYDERLPREIGPSLEAGRSFVVAEYQKSHSALSMLWKGMGRFIVANPRYRHIFGPVSISDRYHSMTKQLLLAFLQTSDHKATLSKLVKATNPPRWGRFRDCDDRELSTIVRSVEDVDELVEEIESDRRGVPVLLRQYLNLNAKLLGFNIDPDFGDVLDGLVLIDLTRVNRTILDFYLGRSGAASFLAHHGADSTAG